MPINSFYDRLILSYIAFWFTLIQVPKRQDFLDTKDREAVAIGAGQKKMTKQGLRINHLQERNEKNADIHQNQREIGEKIIKTMVIIIPIFQMSTDEEAKVIFIQTKFYLQIVKRVETAMHTQYQDTDIVQEGVLPHLGAGKMNSNTLHRQDPQTIVPMYYV